MDKKKSDKKQKGIGALVVGLILVLSSAGELLEDSDAAAAVIFFVIIIAVFAVLAAGKLSKKKKGSSAVQQERVNFRSLSTDFNHSHDRLEVGTSRCKDGYEHWINQLNTFLAAGIIDKAEYRALLQKHPRESFDRTNY